MDIQINQQEDITVVTLSGEVDANTAPKIHEVILPLAEPGSKILLDMTAVPYMSSAGLRLLLYLYRQTTANSAQLVLVGLSEELIDTMAVTGFLDFFTTRPTLAEGKEAF
ncbi:anti-sigma B factor antagonist [Synechocystis sp. PCC 6803]|jgi:anti-sigma B factor antagonist|uniref:Anti-sigma factor antagonist n=1 Tax=Synechocystis sp. (strain ATCC 27184 / PCC 6803 / Kazusa) TaxID=1111708 RepID=P73607_SYNY3|nr:MULTISPECIES: anti-sigma factor antagonist [unclassified Synechocystis]BAM51395.1 anti-sigma B factor antagonist [Synechocystis sp. PCC 6803] [Bacillus subtilis BEST7613]AGF51340.1 anti-sigma B factor antagonist [Synechocystis sp. PCC 6803]ALJ67352.1 anti-sigma B factor antagonist [Synechocystis sp. PCC 6803]AVP89197.1 STAS domain-containing protein [Synechocystis sp. IPPAS B-1465]MBD2617609.1 anti-sigma factor antagonist [Synechocystis sp. FACHB-898]